MTRLVNIAKKISKKTAYLSSFTICAIALIVAVTFLPSANASAGHQHAAVKVSPAFTTATAKSPVAQSATAVATSGTTASANTVSATDPTPASTVKTATPSPKTTPVSSVITPSAPAAPVSPGASEQGVYDGYGYHVQDTQIVETISRTTATYCGGYLCGTHGPTISYNLTSPPAGSFQFVENETNLVEFSIYSGGLSKGNSPAFSPVAINPKAPNGVYKGSIQLQLDTDTNDDYANGPAVQYTVYLTD